MRNMIFGIIGLLWGIGILASSPGQSRGGGAYGAGQSVGKIFGVLLAGAGAIAVVRGVMTLSAAGDDDRPRRRKRKRRPRPSQKPLTPDFDD